MAILDRLGPSHDSFSLIANRTCKGWPVCCSSWHQMPGLTSMSSREGCLQLSTHDHRKLVVLHELERSLRAQYEVLASLRGRLMSSAPLTSTPPCLLQVKSAGRRGGDGDVETSKVVLDATYRAELASMSECGAARAHFVQLLTSIEMCCIPFQQRCKL